MGKKKTGKIVIDLSNLDPSQNSAEFEVEDYDYEQLQREKQHEFDEDLDYLLNSDSKPVSRETPAVSGESPAENGPGTSSSADRLRNALGLDHQSKNKPKNDRLFGKLSDKQTTLSLKDRKVITADIANIGFSSDEEDLAVMLSKGMNSLVIEPTTQKSKKSKKQKQKERSQEPSGQDPGSPKKVADVAVSGSRASTPKSEGPVSELQDSTPMPQSAAVDALEDPVAGDAGEKPKKKRSRKKKNKAANESLDSEMTVSAAEASPPPEEKPQPAGARKSSAKATKLTQLPAIEPKTTIFGLSHGQILRTKITDVKIKKILSSSMSKMCSNALEFTQKETEALFQDKSKRLQFVTLCVNVALYESPGFNSATKQYPAILDWAPSHEALTLSHTKSNLTTSSKQVHQNPLDYNVFAFIGHIILWATALQREAGADTILDQCGLKITKNQILESLGGYFLWDRLRRDKKINTKRWKHIQKFRDIFSFEEHQFVLILRFMNLGIELP